MCYNKIINTITGLRPGYASSTVPARLTFRTKTLSIFKKISNKLKADNDTTLLAKDQKRIKDKKDTIKAVLLCGFGTLMFGALFFVMVSNLFFDYTPIEKLIYGSIAGGLTLLCIFGVLSSLLLYFLQYIWPEKHPEVKYSAAEQKRKSQVHKRLPGRDIFDALAKYRKKYLRNRIIIIAFAMLLVFLIVILRLSDEGINFWICAAIGIGVCALSCIIAGKYDVTFKTDLDIKMIVAKKNIDTLRLNTDFLMATTHKLFDGIAILGMDYLVIYAMRYCDIVNVKEIIHAETFHDVQKISNGTITRCKLRIYMSYNEMITMTMKDDSEMELMANELGIRGIRVEEK